MQNFKATPPDAALSLNTRNRERACHRSISKAYRLTTIVDRRYGEAAFGGDLTGSRFDVASFNAHVTAFPGTLNPTSSLQHEGLFKFSPLPQRS